MKKQDWEEALNEALTVADKSVSESEISLNLLLTSLFRVRRTEMGEEFDSLNNIAIGKIKTDEKHLLEYLQTKLVL